MVTFPTTTKLIAERVNDVRKLAEVPILRLADATGIPRTSLKRKLNGQHDFTIPELQAVTSYLGMDFVAVVRAVAEAA